MCRVCVYRNIQNRTFSIGPDVIQETDSQTHLGLSCDVTLSNKAGMLDASIKLRGTYMDIVKNEMQTKNPSVCCYQQNVFWPWNVEPLCTISPEDHRFCVKHMQRFSMFTRSVFCYLSIDLVPVQMQTFGNCLCLGKCVDLTDLI